jgi:DNA-binding NtrC family response regulator
LAPDLALLDVVLPDGSGVDLLSELASCASSQVVLMSGVGEVDNAFRHMSLASLTYLRKPFDTDELRRTLRKAYKTWRRGANGSAKRIEPQQQFEEMVGQSQPMRQLFDAVSKVAPTEATVLLMGESGTGKELLAHAIHRRSARKNKQFVAINCGAMPETLIDSELFGHEKGAFTGASAVRRGVFEQANGGTLFLDEITEMPLNLQVRLLRVLESGKVQRVGGEQESSIDCRVIAATNRPPSEAIEEGALREDLFYRLAVFPIHVPSLRERSEDVTCLTEHFLRQLNERAGLKKTIAPAAMDAITNYHWPGNVRQLKHAVQRSFIMADDVIELSMLPPLMQAKAQPHHAGDADVGMSIAEVEEELIRATLERYGGDKRKTAEVLGVSVRTLYNRLRQYRKDGIVIEG